VGGSSKFDIIDFVFVIECLKIPHDQGTGPIINLCEWSGWTNSLQKSAKLSGLRTAYVKESSCSMEVSE